MITDWVYLFKNKVGKFSFITLCGKKKMSFMIEKSTNIIPDIFLFG